MKGTSSRFLCIKTVSTLALAFVMSLVAALTAAGLDPDDRRSPPLAAQASHRVSAARAPLSEPVDWYYEGDQQGAQMGYAVATAGDLNGDGYDDVAVGAPIYDSGIDNEGAVFIFYGSVGGLSTFPGATLSGGLKGAEFGCSVSSAGDVNGDGYDDLLVGAKGFKASYSKEGRAFLYYGSRNLPILAPVLAWTFDGGQKDAALGASVSGAGDVNGDGYDDLLVGAPQYSNEDMTEGRAYLFYGSENGPLASPVWIGEGDVAGALFGKAVSDAGDVNGDGYDDVIVSAPLYAPRPDIEGAVFVFYGSGLGLSNTAAWSVTGWQLDSDFGAAVGAAGDVNGDGYDDLLIGAPRYDDDRLNEGAVFGFYGADPWPAFVADWVVEGDREGVSFGVSVGTAGDVNGDGYDDVVVGANHYTYDQSNEGAAFVFHGSATGLREETGWRAEGDKADTDFGFAVSTAGDVDGDGFSDVLVGAPLYRHFTDPLGRAFGYYGPISELSFRVYLPLVARPNP